MPPRTHQAWLLLVLLSLFTLPLLEVTFHALVEFSAFVVAGQYLFRTLEPGGKS